MEYRCVRIGFDDNRTLGGMETGGRAALPVFRELMLNTYQAKLVGPAPSFPADMENNIAAYLNGKFTQEEAARFFNSPDTGDAAADRIRFCRAASTLLATKACEVPLIPLPVVYQLKDGHGRIVFYERVKQFTPLVEITYPQHQPPFPSLAARWPLLHFCWSGCARKVLLVAQSFDGIKVGGFSGRVEAKADSHQGCREQELAEAVPKEMRLGKGRRTGLSDMSERAEGVKSGPQWGERRSSMACTPRPERRA